jgi:hypothetical protein
LHCLLTGWTVEAAARPSPQRRSSANSRSQCLRRLAKGDRDGIVDVHKGNEISGVKQCRAGCRRCAAQQKPCRFCGAIVEKARDEYGFLSSTRAEWFSNEAGGYQRYGVTAPRACSDLPIASLDSPIDRMPRRSCGRASLSSKAGRILSLPNAQSHGSKPCWSRLITSMTLVCRGFMINPGQTNRVFEGRERRLPP